jgi:hybrid cluster-associated redox disulfide protein
MMYGTLYDAPDGNILILSPSFCLLLGSQTVRFLLTHPGITIIWCIFIMGAEHKVKKNMVKAKITEDMNIREVIEAYPTTIGVFAKYNMGCIGCIAASFEKIKDIAAVHGVDVKKFVKDLNNAVDST